MTPSRSRVLVALAAVVFAASLPNEAAAKPNATAGKEEFDKAARYYKAQEYEAALPWFQKAYELSGKRPSTIRALAQCERSLKMYDEAIVHFREYLATKPPESEAKSVRKTIDLLEELKTSRDALAASQKNDAPEVTPPIGSTPVEKRETKKEVAETPPLDAPPVVEAPVVEKTERRETKIETKSTEVSPAPTELPRYTPPPRMTTTTETHIEESSNALPYITIGTSAAVAVFGAALLAIGRSDVSKVESAPDGTPFSGEIEDAANRAPTFTGLGAGLLIAGLAGTGVGIAWLVSDDDDDDQIVTGTTINTSDRGAR